MNRIILIGNGFDLAHDLPTKYTDFINSYWADFASKIFSNANLEPYEDKRENYIYAHFAIDRQGCDQTQIQKVATPISTYKELLAEIDTFNAKQQEFCKAHRNRTGNNYCRLSFRLTVDNSFLRRISDKCIDNWVDVEREYYEALKYLLITKDINERSKKVKKLHEEFDAVRNLLEKYLTKVCEQEAIPKGYILTDIIASGIKYKDVAISKRKAFLDSIPKEKSRVLSMVKNAPPQYDHLKRMNDQQLDGEIEQGIKNSGIDASHTLLLNFNYTDTVEKLFGRPDDEYDWDDYSRWKKRPILDIINIHGKLNSADNPIIFGYGDELDEEYEAIERTQDNNFLENIKSIKYHNTGSYRKLLDFLQDEPYQVFILGHSCGNSDRTLLNTIFEHENCISIKPFFWDKGNGEDDYTEKVMNISRNFNNKQNLRDIVVSKERCQPLVPCDSEAK